MSDHRETQASDEPHGICPGEWRGASGLCMCVECVRRREAAHSPPASQPPSPPAARAQAVSGLTAEQLEDRAYVFQWLDVYRDNMTLHGCVSGVLSTIDSLASENATLKEQLAAKERECERLQAWHDIENEVCGVFSFQLDRIREHRGEDGKISGDGRWRIEEIWGCIQKMIAAEDRANFKMDEWTKQNEALNIAPAAEGGGE
jgi:hypothetical protein